MRQLFGAVIGTLLLLQVVTGVPFGEESGNMANAAILRARSWNNVLIPAGDNMLPDEDGIGIPKRTAGADVRVSRENWPAEGVTLYIEVTYDSLTWEVCAGPQTFFPGVPDPRTGVLNPAGLGCGWNADRGKQPVRGRLRVVNDGAQFRANASVEFHD